MDKTELRLLYQKELSKEGDITPFVMLDMYDPGYIEWLENKVIELTKK
jgi:hypothetical protein